uniref:Uncharacterized protein n=1 Tax=Equus asinus TaxID=9793 RepID=A0A9L0KCD0_EQUAS
MWKVPSDRRERLVSTPDGRACCGGCEGAAELSGAPTVAQAQRSCHQGTETWLMGQTEQKGGGHRQRNSQCCSVRSRQHLLPEALWPRKPRIHRVAQASPQSISPPLPLPNPKSISVKRLSVAPLLATRPSASLSPSRVFQ